MFRTYALAAMIGVLCSSNAMTQDAMAQDAMAQDHVDRDKLTQAVVGMLGNTPEARVTILGTAAASTPTNEVIYFTYSPDGQHQAWYVANCAKFAEGGWLCPIAPVGQAFILHP
jgi:hypothetical protein